MERFCLFRIGKLAHAAIGPVPGAIIVGGLNPIAILEEREHRVFSRALSGLLEYERLFPFKEFPLRLQKYL